MCIVAFYLLLQLVDLDPELDVGLDVELDVDVVPKGMGLLPRASTSSMSAPLDRTICCPTSNFVYFYRGHQDLVSIYCRLPTESDSKFHLKLGIIKPLIKTRNVIGAE